MEGHLADLVSGFFEEGCRCFAARRVRVIDASRSRLLLTRPRAKKQVTEQGGKVVDEYKLVKGFRYIDKPDVPF